MKQAMQERSLRSAGTNVVAGGTEESIAAEKEAQNNALAGVTGNIVTEGEAHKDAIEGQYMQKRMLSIMLVWIWRLKRLRI